MANRQFGLILLIIACGLFKGGVRHARNRRSQRGSLESNISTEEEKIPSLTIEHFQQNGNIKNIAHIDASTNELTIADLNKKVVNKLGGEDIVESELSKPSSDNKTEVITVPETEPKEIAEVEIIPKGYSLIRFPKEKSCFRKIMWFVIWPIHFLFMLTIPDCERPSLKRWFPITFLMCIIWIGSLSYLVAWMITILGDTLKIPDSVMGITFLAAGTSVPEAVSSVIVAKQVMYCNDIMATKVRTIVSNLKRKPNVRPYREVTEIAPLLNKEGQSTDKFIPTTELEKIDEENCEFADTPWKRSADSGRIAFIARWPITLALWLTIPDCRKYPKLRMLTFFMYIFWIGLTSYFVAFLITVVGDTINIPDSVMGLTFLAAGTSVPEAVSSVIVTNQGHGAMGISNSIGSNTFDILLCLGLPWFVKSYFLPNVPDEKWITLNSTGLTYSAVSLLSTLFGLYISFAVNKFRLDWKIGLTCTIMYIAFLIFASLVELNFFFPVNLPICDH